MKRGDLVTVANSGDYGKPRPAVVVQANDVSGTQSVLVCPLTGSLAPPVPFRVRIEPDEHNGLKKQSDAMTDKLTAVLRSKCGPAFGKVSDDVLDEIELALSFILGLAE
ncbi:MAG: type II toxin-antitoxin system PemK/MazF family toxin [Sphingomonadaceae bacterium]